MPVRVAPPRHFCRALRDYLRYTEVEQLHLATLGEEEVCWLNVAMQDAFRVCGIERVGYLNGIGQ